MTSNHEFALLNALNDAHPYGVPKSALFADVNIRLSRSRMISLGDFDTLLHDTEKKGRIRSTRGEDDVLVKITDDGRLRLSDFR